MKWGKATVNVFWGRQPKQVAQPQGAAQPSSEYAEEDYGDQFEEHQHEGEDDEWLSGSKLKHAFKNSGRSHCYHYLLLAVVAYLCATGPNSSKEEYSQA